MSFTNESLNSCRGSCGQIVFVLIVLYVLFYGAFTIIERESLINERCYNESLDKSKPLSYECYKRLK